MKPKKNVKKAIVRKVVVYNYIHFKTPFGVVTIPTTGRYEEEESNAIMSLKTYLKNELSTLAVEGEKKTAAASRLIKKMKDFLNAHFYEQCFQIHCLGWSNVVTPKRLGTKAQQIVIVENAIP